MTKTKVILCGPGVGKTFLDTNFTNVYDFDKNTLDYKWERKGFEHLSDEEFKGLPNRVEKKNWFSKYKKDMLERIKSEEYDVVSTLVNEELIDMLKENDIDFNVIIFNPKKEEMILELKKRLSSRGNSDIWVQNSITYVENLYKTHSEEDYTLILNEPTYLSEYLEERGIKLKSK